MRGGVFVCDRGIRGNVRCKIYLLYFCWHYLEKIILCAATSDINVFPKGENKALF